MNRPHEPPFPGAGREQRGSDAERARREDLNFGVGRVEFTDRNARYNPVQILTFRVQGAPRTST
jgi:hypothetical protein